MDDGASPVRLHPRPSHAKVVVADTKPPQQCHVLLEEAMVVTCDVAIGSSLHFLLELRERVPDPPAAPIDIRATLDLVGRTCHAPNEGLRESAAPVPVLPLVPLHHILLGG
eukprot:CAMPEP_0180555314 /NCGR_PEP_ID=MMETSP1036_2-20121128/75358_1 /TAXON_ID=632150 /ORGANISM="Azadinium spinosum, Strain 3D9" /LENGTH=110 /DNA_ID=CAMNT_0022571117 /DNA_START=1234 /DNA_END=1563 /DNA_ORIENTATION=-